MPMTPKALLTLVPLGALLLAPLAAADPPGTCLGGGYHAGALTNVCYQAGSGSVDTGSVGIGTVTTVCPIGNLCVPVVAPTYDPNGGTAVPVPGPGSTLYVEALGIPILTVPCAASGTGIQVVEGCHAGGCASGIAGTPLCVEPLPSFGPCENGGATVAGYCVLPGCSDSNGNGNGFQVGTRCVLLTCTDANGNPGILAGNRCVPLSKP